MIKLFLWSLGMPMSYFNQLDRATKGYRSIAGALFLILLPLEGVFFAMNMQQFMATGYAVLAGLLWFTFWFFIDRAIFASMDRSQARGETNYAMVAMRIAIIGVMSFINSNAILGTLMYANDLKAFYVKDAEQKMADLRAPLDSAAAHYNTKKIVVFYTYKVDDLEQQSIDLRTKTAYEMSGDTLMGATGSEGDGNVAAGVRKEQEGATSAAAKARAAAEAELAASDEAVKYFELKKRYEGSSEKMEGSKPGYRDMARGLSEIRSQNPGTFWMWEGLFFLVSCLPFIIKGALTKNDKYIAILSTELTITTQAAATEFSARVAIRENAVQAAHATYNANVTSAQNNITDDKLLQTVLKDERNLLLKQLKQINRLK